MASTVGTITVPKIKTYSQTGPASYATGGFVITGLTGDYSWVGHIDVAVTTRGVLPGVDFEIFKNVNASGTESLGNGGVKIVRGMYDKATLNAITGLPGGVTAQSAKFAAATTTGSSHNHSIDHDHPAVTSSGTTAAGAAINLAAGGATGGMTHTHDFNVPAFTGNSSSDTHSHERSFEYDHDHAINAATVTDTTITEITNATDLSGVTFKFTVYGFGEA